MSVRHHGNLQSLEVVRWMQVTAGMSRDPDLTITWKRQDKNPWIGVRERRLGDHDEADRT